MGDCMSKNMTADELEEAVGATFQHAYPRYGRISSSLLGSVVSNKLFVKNMDADTAKEEIRTFFLKFGKVMHVRRQRNCKTTAFVIFSKNVDWRNVYQASPDDLRFGKKFLHIDKLKERETNWQFDDVSDVVSGGNECAVHWLPNEMLDYIFSFLSIKERIQTERVCRRWRDMGTDLHWRWPVKLDLGDIEAFWEDDSLLLTDQIVASILSRCGKSVKQLELSTKAAHARLVTRQALVTIGKFCPNLTEINLDDLPEVEKFPPKQYLEPLALGCPNLRHVTIMNTSLTDECLSAYFNQCESQSASKPENLEMFSLVRNDMIVGGCFQDINKELKGLRLFGCYRVQPDIAFVKLMERCENLEELSLRYCCESLKPALLSQILNCYKRTLKILRLDGHGIMPAAWCECLSLLHGVAKVSLEKCNGVQDEVLQAMANKCVNLHVLNISGTRVSDDGVTALAKKCESLHALNVCETLITDEGVSALAIECRHLCALNVSFTSITDVGVSVLASALRLKVLDISYTSNVTGVGIYDLAEKGLIEELYIRAINRHDNVVQEGCLAIAKFCPNFRVLDVRATKNINNALVDNFRTALDKGFLRGPVYLYVGLTKVKEDCRQSDKLKIYFNATFKIDFFNRTYFDGN